MSGQPSNRSTRPCFARHMTPDFLIVKGWMMEAIGSDAGAGKRL